MIQIRNVPPELHRKLKARAAEQGMTLSDYLLRVVEREAGVLTPAEIRERLSRLPPVEASEPVAVTIRRMREENG